MENNGLRRMKQKGLTLIITVLAMAVLIPMVGLAIDTSLLYAIKAKMQAAVDAASLSGARSLNRGQPRRKPSSTRISHPGTWGRCIAS
jgi:Flp pilus assembly protein TadG